LATEDTEMAVKSAGEDGRSIRSAAKGSGIRYSKLQKILKQGQVSTPKMERKPVFSEEKEQAVTDHLVKYVFVA
jgi:hypothetical protein